MFLNRDAIYKLIYVAHAVPPTCPMPNSLEFLKQLLWAFLPSKESKYFILIFMCVLKNYYFLIP